MINENENEKIELTPETEKGTDSVISDNVEESFVSSENESEMQAENSETETAEVTAAENEAECKNCAPTAEEIAQPSVKTETYAFRWRYSDQYEHDKLEASKSGKGSVKRERVRGGIAVFITVLIIAFAFAFAVLALSLSFDDMSKWFNRDPDVELSVSDITEKAMPSAVSIYAGSANKTSIGSGFVVNDKGYVVTNYHVVENSVSIIVSGSDGSQYSANLVGYDKDNDIAVLYAEKCKLPAIAIGDSNKLKLGETVVAIGTPSGEELAFSVSNGIVSGLKRNVAGKNIGMIQTNAPLNPGNSGGPLVDSGGNVVGIVTLKYSFTGLEEEGQNLPYEGLAFALPISEVIGEIEQFILEDLKSAKIGITGASVESGRSYFMNESEGRLYPCEKLSGKNYYVDSYGKHHLITEEMLNVEGNRIFTATATGIMIADVTEGLGAYGKLAVGDIVIEANGTSVRNVSEISKMCQNKSAGDIIRMTFYRDGARRTAAVVLMTKRDMLNASN